ncbi:hypothetical protein M408DRAFT_332555 [Serendipita vermifera MAFF 305830]|uniref:Uncharacterized protein n=1 Tax=Serendipita vermifera MAFF 305830 TaxID=933852 RepID=A0A0C2W9J4_SERVB|nr:hypothetical protein M408DRAFT_332555 [Serendipita vermifera MAFF 305830]
MQWSSLTALSIARSLALLDDRDRDSSTNTNPTILDTILEVHITYNLLVASCA